MDTPANWAARELRKIVDETMDKPESTQRTAARIRNLAGFISPDTTYGWVHNKLINTALELEAVQQMLDRVDALDKDGAGA